MIYGTKKQEITVNLKEYNEELQNFNSSLTIVWLIKSRRVGRVQYVARMGVKANAYCLSVGKPQRKRSFRYLSINWCIIRE
jgi:hypothetical protein